MDLPNVDAPVMERELVPKVSCKNCKNSEYPLNLCDFLYARNCVGCPCAACDMYCALDYNKFKSRSKRPKYEHKYSVANQKR